MRLPLGLALTAAAFAATGPGNGRVDSGAGLPQSQLSLTASQEEPSSAIRSVLSTQQAAWNRGDIRTFLDGYWNSPQLTFAGSDGIVRGYDGLLARYQKSYPDKQAMGQLDFSGLEIRPLGADAALVLGQWHLKRQAGDLGGVFSLVLERFPAGWRIVHDHTSRQNHESDPIQ
jgi:ketosteroid isomerase-like protein